MLNDPAAITQSRTSIFPRMQNKRNLIPDFFGRILLLLVFLYCILSPGSTPSRQKSELSIHSFYPFILLRLYFVTQFKQKHISILHVCVRITQSLCAFLFDAACFLNNRVQPVQFQRLSKRSSRNALFSLRPQ